MKAEKYLVRVSYWDKGQEYGLEEVVDDIQKVHPAVDFILETLSKDYNARHPGENP